MTDLALDPASHDLAFDGGTFALVDGANAIAQNVKIRLRFFLGEWFLDSRLGIPYFQKILGKKLRQNLIDAIYKKAILTTPGIASLADLTSTYDGPTRRLTIAFTAVTDAGDVIEFSEPFIIGSPVG